MRIVIDMQGMQTSASANRGVGRYTEELTRNLILTAEGRHEVFLAMNGCMPEGVDRIRSIFAGIVPDDRFIVWQQFFSTAVSTQPDDWFIKAGELVREATLNCIKPDVIFTPNLQEGWHDSAVTSVHRFPSSALYCSTLHDLVPFHYQNEYLGDPNARKWYESKLEHAKFSDLLITVSEDSRKEILKFLGLSSESVFTVHNGYDKNLFYAKPIEAENSQSILEKYRIKEKFILYYGGNDPHKNINRLINAYALLPTNIKKSFSLVLAGGDFVRNESFRNSVKKLGLDSNVIMPGFVPDHDLPTLLRACACFVYPSTHEGFGLPALEAMACGAPVIGAKGSAVEELIENKRALFDPFDVQDISARLYEVLINEPMRAELANQGLLRAENFSWTKAAKSIWTMLEQELERHSSSEQLPPITEQTVINELATAHLPVDKDGLKALAYSLAETFPSKRSPNIFFDISRVVVEDHRTGIQRVTRAIVQELAGSQSGADILAVYTSPKSFGFRAANSYMSKNLGLIRPEQDEVIDFVAGDVLVMLDLHPGVAIGQQEYLNYLRRKGVRIFFIVYDLIPLLRPDLFWPELCEEFRNWVEVVCKYDGALCISNSVANDFSEYVSSNEIQCSSELKINYFHLGADLESTVPSRGMPTGADVLLKQLATGTSFLMVGTIEPRKGHREVLSAFEACWTKGIDATLVIVGKQGWKMEAFINEINNHPYLGRRLIYLQQISDELLNELYAACSCLLAASECEGFGLPLIEAAQHKLPIIARDIPVFREVAGEHAFYFKADKSEQLAEAIQNWIEFYKNNAHPKSENMPWLTWKQSAQQLLAAIGLPHADTQTSVTTH